MANFTFGNNPNAPTAAAYDEEGNQLSPFIPAEPSPSAKITDENGVEKIILPGMSVGLPIGRYTIEVINDYLLR